VHGKGGHIFLQLWNCGRIGSSAIFGGKEPLSPSGVNDDLGQLQVYGFLSNGTYAQIAATPSRAMTQGGDPRDGRGVSCGRADRHGCRIR
jgi:NADPH2 dehydrogenase/N-ethylmaleimide reductase